MFRPLMWPYSGR